MARQTQKGRGFGVEVKGALFSDTQGRTIYAPYQWPGHSSLAKYCTFTGYHHMSPMQIGTHTHFIAKLHLIHTHSHAGIQHLHSIPIAPVSYFHFHSKLHEWPQEVIKLSFCHLGAGLILEPGFLPVWLAVLPSWFLCLTRFSCASWVPHPNLPGRRDPPLDQAVHWHLVGSLLLVVQGTHPSNKGGKKAMSLQSQQWAPRNVMENSNRDTGHWGKEVTFYCTGTDSGWLVSKDWAPKTKKSHIIYPCKQVTQTKNPRFNPYMVIWNSIGYFTSWHLDSLGFICLLCHPLLPATLSEHRPICFFFGPLLYYKTVLKIMLINEKWMKDLIVAPKVIKT
jgi:hypothetical protein